MIVLSDEKQICMLGHVQYHIGEDEALQFGGFQQNSWEPP